MAQFITGFDIYANSFLFLFCCELRLIMCARELAKCANAKNSANANDIWYTVYQQCNP